MTSYIRIAGWRWNLRGLARHGETIPAMMPARIDEYEELLTNNRIWQGRLKGVGRLPAEH